VHLSRKHRKKRSGRLAARWAYYRRVASAYLGKSSSHLTFWHGTPEVNPHAPINEVGEYYMRFAYKADYEGPFDEQGIPRLDYHGDVGEQYNPIAIAQYALGHYNRYRETGDLSARVAFLKQADWLVENLEANNHGVLVWNHHFDWEYRDLLTAPWYSALAQGHGLSVLVRAHQETGNDAYLSAAHQAFVAFTRELEEGGVRHTDSDGYVWLEETIVYPPTHILNGYLWALWGIHDYRLITENPSAKALYEDCLRTLRDRLESYDIGFWSLYEHAGKRLQMMASPFYHSLHIVQLRVTHRLTGEPFFGTVADRWDRYQRTRIYRFLSFGYKVLFKILYY